MTALQETNTWEVFIPTLWSKSNYSSRWFDLSETRQSHLRLDWYTSEDSFSTKLKLTIYWKLAFLNSTCEIYIFIFSFSARQNFFLLSSRRTLFFFPPLVQIILCLVMKIIFRPANLFGCLFPLSLYWSGRTMMICSGMADFWEIWSLLLQMVYN